MPAQRQVLHSTEEMRSCSIHLEAQVVGLPGSLEQQLLRGGLLLAITMGSF